MNRDETEIKKQLELWLEYAQEDPDVAEELQTIRNSPEKAADAFYKELEFGTGGLRGVIGAGTNRMNIYTVAKASMGLANYIKKHVQEGKPSIAISYDSRIKSDIFSKIAAEVFAANDIQVHIYSELMPTPMLSWAVRRLGCAGGVMITASHNPSKYNGYKVYGADGCQITTEAAADILQEINAVDTFQDVKKLDFEEGIRSGKITYIQETVITDFIEEIEKQSMIFSEAETIAKDVAIVYSPLNGTGLKPVLRTLKESGFTNVTVVKEQEKPDGNFPTCPYPNPEIEEAMKLGMDYAKRCQADLLLATDPDCDRVGIAVRDIHSDTGKDYVLLSGNEVGLLLLDYICKRRIAEGKMPEHPVFMKTIVTMDLAERVAAHCGVHTINVLTGFKFIGEQIGLLETQGREEDYILGFEESYGYLSGSYVRDKDAVNGAFLICEMYAYYKAHGMELLEVLDGIYQEYGYCLNTLHSYIFEGMEGFGKMQGIMGRLRGLGEMLGGPGKGEEVCFGERKIVAVEDYLSGKKYFADGSVKEMFGLPASNVLKFLLEGDSSVVVRPSGTEPKLKLYVSVCGGDEEGAGVEERKLVGEIEELFWGF